MARGRPAEAEPLLLECHRALTAGETESATELEAVRKSLVELYGSLGQPTLAEDYRAGR